MFKKVFYATWKPRHDVATELKTFCKSAIFTVTTITQ
jgi:hypothetical protein